MHDYKNDCTNGLRCILGGTDVPKMSNDASLEGQMYQWAMMHDRCTDEQLRIVRFAPRACSRAPSAAAAGKEKWKIPIWLLVGRRREKVIRGIHSN